MRTFPEIKVVNTWGEVIGALDVKRTNFHVTIIADRAMSFGEQFSMERPYHLKINNGGAGSTYFVKHHCIICNAEHYILKEKPESGIDTLNVKLLRDPSPFTLSPGIFIYNDVRFICA